MTESDPLQNREDGLNPSIPPEGIIFDISNMPVALVRTIEGFSQTIEYHKRHDLPLSPQPNHGQDGVEL